MTAAAGPRLQRLLEYLSTDPGNLRLIEEAVEAAVEAGEDAEAETLIARYAEASPLPPTLLNLKGLSALRRADYAAAADDFAAVLENLDAAPVRFNLAWCKAMTGDWASVATLINEDTSEEAPGAASLKVQALHHLGEVEAAVAWGQEAAGRHPEDSRLLGAVASAALDAEDLEVAARFAVRAGDTAEATAVRGMLALADDKTAEAGDLFENALAQAPHDGRALLGMGLTQLAEGRYAAAAGWIDQAARVFKVHTGSWVSAGWAHFAAGDVAASRERFETALAIDDAFAEVHGGLAVLDIVSGDVETARRRAETALRLDRECFAGALARILILTHEGDRATAERLRAIAMSTPAGLGGRTVGQAMTRIGQRPRR